MLIQSTSQVVNPQKCASKAHYIHKGGDHEHPYESKNDKSYTL